MKFDFSKSTIQSDDDLEKTLAADKTFEDAYLRPGVHEVVIKSAAYYVPAQGARVVGDPSWMKLDITYEGTGGKTLRDFSVLVPTKDLQYTTKKGDKSNFALKRINKFNEALGIPTLKPSNAPTVLTENFSKPEKSLVGRAAKITVGFSDNHVEYAGKDEAGIKKYIIRMKDGSTLLNKDGKTVQSFPEFDAATEYCQQHNIMLQKFAGVTDWAPSATASKASGSW